MDRREDALRDQNERIDDKNARYNELVQQESDRLFNDMNTSLGNREAGLNQREVDLQTYKNGVDAKERNKENLIGERTQELYDNRKAELQGAYDTRKGQLDSRQGELDRREANIDNTVRERVERELQPFRDDLRRTEDRAATLRRLLEIRPEDAEAKRHLAELTPD